MSDKMCDLFFCRTFIGNYFRASVYLAIARYAPRKASSLPFCKPGVSNPRSSRLRYATRALLLTKALQPFVGFCFLNQAIPSSGVPRNFVRGGGVQQIQLRTEDRETGDLGAIVP